MEALLEDLRDIHLPLLTEGGMECVFAPEPFVVLAVVVFVVIGLSLWHRGRWLRIARARLNALKSQDSGYSAGFSQVDDPWPALVDFAAEVAARTRTTRLPDCVFAEPSRIGEEERGELLHYLQTSLRTQR